jgi:HAD superfamily hydrolase (TIGR01509 family)
MPTNFPFDAVLWDMDGTLIDSEPIWIAEETIMMQELGIEWSEEDALHCLGGPLERVDTYMRERSGNQHAPLELAHKLIDRLVLRLSNGIEFSPGAESLINEIHHSGIPMALVSASTRKIMNAALVSIGEEFFRFTCSADEVSKTKPDPEGYLTAAKRLGVDIERSLIIEDSKTGMTAAIASGAYVLGLPHLTDLPSGEKVVQRKGLQDLNLHSLGLLFEGVVV